MKKTYNSYLVLILWISINYMGMNEKNESIDNIQ